MSSDAIIYYVSNKFLKKKNLPRFGILTFSRVPAPS